MRYHSLLNRDPTCLLDVADGLFHGMRVVLSPVLTEAASVTVRRSWRERLISWPWRPWVRERVEVTQVPSGSVLTIDGRTLLMHPWTWERLKGQLDGEGRS